MSFRGHFQGVRYWGPSWGSALLLSLASCGPSVRRAHEPDRPSGASIGGPASGGPASGGPASSGANAEKPQSVAGASATVPEEPREPVVIQRPRQAEAWFGVQLVPRVDRAEVKQALSGSPAERLGLRSGDVIVALDEVQVTSAEQLTRYILERRPGDKVRVVWDRGASHHEELIALEASPHPEDWVRLLLVGRKAPEISGVVTFQGETASLREVAGRVLVLEFWASYCPPCKNVGEVVQAWFDELRPLGFTVLGVTSDPPLRGSEVARARNMSYPLASDPRGEIARAYAAREIPMVVLIDQRGYVRDVVLGYEPNRLVELRQQIDQLLALSP